MHNAQKTLDSRRKEAAAFSTAAGLSDMDVENMDKSDIERSIASIETALSLPNLPDMMRANLEDTLNVLRQKLKDMSGDSRGMEKAAAGIAKMGEAMRSLSAITDEGATAWLNYAAQGAQAIAQLINSIAAMIPAKQAEAMASAAAGAASTGPLGWVTIGAALASVIAAFASIPKFAEGGIAYGPTLGMFGEYAGAASNPEVVAPLDKLKSLIGSDAQQTVRVEIDGHKLVGFINKEYNHYKRV